jgi:hypothetical protein
MTAAQFRKLALSFAGAVESSHMNHPDFRVGGKIFATLTPGEAEGVVMLSPDEQEGFIAEAPKTFAPAQGAWGRNGSTRVHLAGADFEMVRSALEAAWRKRAAAKRIRDRKKHP